MSDNVKKSFVKNKAKGNQYIRIFLSGLAGVGIYFLLMFLFSFVPLKLGTGEVLFVPFGLVCAIAGGFFSGYSTARPIMQRGLIYGLIGGLICLLLCSVILFAVNGGTAGSGIIINSAVILVSSAVGGIVAVSSKPKRKY